MTYLAHEVCILILILLADDDGILESGVVYLDLASFELGHDLKAAFLLAVLVKSEGVVLLLRLARLATFAFSGLLASTSTSSSTSSVLNGTLSWSSAPSISLAARGSPVVVLCGGVSGSTSLSLEFGNRLISAPALVDLLVRVTSKKISVGVYAATITTTVTYVFPVALWRSN